MNERTLVGVHDITDTDSAAAEMAEVVEQPRVGTHAAAQLSSDATSRRHDCNDDGRHERSKATVRL